MLIVWDELKRLSNLQKHGLDFADLTNLFFLDAVIVSGKSGRLRAVNGFGDGVITVVFARLGTEGISIISMRPASRKERKL